MTQAAASPTESAPEKSEPAPVEWAPEHQMANMLGLCEAQMESALQESAMAVDALILAFTGLAATTRDVASHAEGLPDDLRSRDTRELDMQVAAISQQMNSAVIAFQFYDKLTQRLDHVRYSLSTLALFVCNPAQSGAPDQWRRLHNSLRRLYRTKEEQAIFQTMMDGADEPVVAISAPAQTKIGEVELF